MARYRHFKSADLQQRSGDRTRSLRRHVMIGVIAALGGASFAAPFADAVSLNNDRAAQLAQSSSGDGQTPGSTPPAESKPGGTRPTTPAPEPARPDPSAQMEGAPAALPPAPAEKTAAPIDAK